VGRERGLGATHLGGHRCRLLVWAPRAEQVEVRLVGSRERVMPMAPVERGYHFASVDGVDPGDLYLYRLNGRTERPDPASYYQPQGVHGPSQVVDLSSFVWEDEQWFGLPLQDYIIYELHVGTFTPEGTFDAIIPRLDQLRNLGVTAIEIMPVAQFPGSRNWGYDGVYPFAVQDSYGGPEGLKRLVNACHMRGLVTIMDVVYNHLGPEGNYLADFGPYFTDLYRTPWGAAINFDGAGSDEVRRFFIENALYWITEFHVDALRLDAIHGIRDFSARTFLEELGISVHDEGERLNRRLYVIAESNFNDARVILPRYLGGYGLDAQWNDDFHHSLHTLLTGERSGYYEDFHGLADLTEAFREGFVYTGQYSAYRQRRHGNSSRLAHACQFVVSVQNHDQVGNRMKSERLADLVSFDTLKLAAGALLLSPFVPLLFMGEEYGEIAPFFYFISHSDPELVEAVRKGRKEEFAAFGWRAEVPDPQDEATFQRSRLQWENREGGQHRVLLDLYTELIRLRKELPALRHLSKEDEEVAGFEDSKVLLLRRWAGEEQAFVAFNFGEAQAGVALRLPPGAWHKRFDSSAQRWNGNGEVAPSRLESRAEIALTLPPRSFVLYAMESQSPL